MSPKDLRGEAFSLLARIVVRSEGSLEALAVLGLTMTQLRVLFSLRAEAGLSAGALAEMLGVAPSTLTRIMDRLVRSQMVKREPDESDRRLVRHLLTSSGLGTVEEVERAGRVRMNLILEHLSPEQLERLVVALRDLNAAAQAADGVSERVEA
ncbi:MAG: MarR family winged helix-turn-helix transcriptional regulator [Dehalococcoidia bacterium]